MRIGILHGYELTGSGSNEYTRYLSRALARAGHEVHLLCREPDPERFQEDGCTVHVLPDASVRPRSESTHLKIAFFFRKSAKGERRVKRALARVESVATEDDEALETALALSRQQVAHASPHPRARLPPPSRAHPHPHTW